MSTRATGIAGAALVAALSLAGCSASESPEAEQTPATTTVTVEATPSQQPTSTPTKDTSPPATAAPSTTSPSPSTAETAGAGQRCDLGKPDTVGLVVKGSLTCKTLRGVWKRAVANPDFAHHGNHNRIVVDDWTCRAHQTRPVQTGFCSTDDYRTKFKIIHR